MRHLLDWRVSPLSSAILSALYSTDQPTTATSSSSTIAPAAALSPAGSNASGSCSNGPRLKRERFTPEEFAQHLRLRPDSLALHALLRLAALDFGLSGIGALTSQTSGVAEALSISHAALSFLTAAFPASTLNSGSSAMDACIGPDVILTPGTDTNCQQKYPPLLDSIAFSDLTGRLFTGLREVLLLCAFSQQQQTGVSNGLQNGNGAVEMAASDHQKSPRKRTRKPQEKGASGALSSVAPDTALFTLLQSARVALEWSNLQQQQFSEHQSAAASGSSCVVVAPEPVPLAGGAVAKILSAFVVELLVAARSLPILLAKVPEVQQRQRQVGGTVPSIEQFQPARLVARTVTGLAEYLLYSGSGEPAIGDEILKVNDKVFINTLVAYLIY